MTFTHKALCGLAALALGGVGLAAVPTHAAGLSTITETPVSQTVPGATPTYFTFTSVSATPQVQGVNSTFQIGTVTFNIPAGSPSPVNGSLNTTLAISAPAVGNVSFATPIQYSATGGSQTITLTPTQTTFNYGGQNYNLSLAGFRSGGGATSNSFALTGGTGTTGVYASLSTPEPSSVAAFALTGLGMTGLLLKARKRRFSA